MVPLALSKTALTPFIKSLLMQPPNLSTDDLAIALRLIFNQIPSEVQISSFLTALSIAGLDKDPKYVASAAKTILEFSDIPTLTADQIKGKVFTDIVGTGGDGQNTFNVSTSSAIVVSGISFAKIVVTKHGGKAATSTSGAGDLVAHLGIDTSRINSRTIPSLIDDYENKFLFLFAPTFHSGMKIVADVRKQLGIPTIFNILGPLLNPIPLQSRVLGVYSEELGPIYINAIKTLYPDNKYGLNSKNKYRTVVVWGEVGLDEVSPEGKTKIWFLDPETHEVCHDYISPSDFGLSEHSLDSVRSGTPEENANLLKTILNGEIDVESGHPVVDYILLNSSMLAVSCGVAHDWKHGVRLAKESIRSGGALRSLDQLTQSLDLLD